MEKLLPCVLTMTKFLQDAVCSQSEGLVTLRRNPNGCDTVKMNLVRSEIGRPSHVESIQNRSRSKEDLSLQSQHRVHLVEPIEEAGTQLGLDSGVSHQWVSLMHNCQFLFAKKSSQIVSTIKPMFVVQRSKLDWEVSYDFRLRFIFNDKLGHIAFANRVEVRRGEVWKSCS